MAWAAEREEGAPATVGAGHSCDNTSKPKAWPDTSQGLRSLLLLTRNCRSKAKGSSGQPQAQAHCPAMSNLSSGPSEPKPMATLSPAKQGAGVLSPPRS